MKLFLCEKPSQAKDIATVLGAGNRQATHIATAAGVVTWAIGHLLELAEPETYGEQYGRWDIAHLPIIPEPFQMVPKATTKTQFRAVGELLKKATEVIVATDADREGEMIARELLTHFRFRGRVSRLWLSALDPESVRKALAKLKRGEETESLYYAALARSRADWLVGMNLTRAATLLCRKPGEKGVISIGRVQTPTLALVVRRDREIETFKPRDYFEIVADVLAATKDRVSLRYAPRDEDRIYGRADADSIAAKARGASGPLTVEKALKSQAPPALFSLATFQMRANALFGWSADKSLSIAQALYETHKATSYPRTDCPFLPEEQIADVPAIVANLTAIPELNGAAIPEPPIIRKTVFNTAKVTAHHAIIPTKAAPDTRQMSEDELKGFLLIARSYLAALMPDYEFEQTRISMDAAGVTFTTTGNVPKRPGWRSLYRAEDPDEQTHALPSIPDGTPAKIESAVVEAKKTKPPERYTEGTLIADMKSVAKFVTDPARKARLKESSGIGTEATRAAIIKTLRTREFLMTKGKQIISTPKARSLISLLEVNLPSLADPGETAVWEDHMELIVEGKTTCDGFINEVAARIREYVGTLSGAAPARPVTDAVTHPETTPGEAELLFRGKPVRDGGDRWHFDAVAGVFKKTILQRPMSAQDYIAIFDAAPDALPQFDGFISDNTRRPFTARLRYNPNRTFKSKLNPGVEFVF